MDVDQGRLDPAQEPDEFMGAMVRRLGLLDDWPRLAIELANASASWSGPDEVKVTLCWPTRAMARGLGPFILDTRASMPPDRPKLLGSDFPWDKIDGRGA